MKVVVYEFGPGVMVIEGIGVQLCPGCAAEETALDLTDVDALTQWFCQAHRLLAGAGIKIQTGRTHRQLAEDYLKEPWHEES